MCAGAWRIGAASRLGDAARPVAGGSARSWRSASRSCAAVVDLFVAVADCRRRRARSPSASPTTWGARCAVTAIGSRRGATARVVRDYRGGVGVVAALAREVRSAARAGAGDPAADPRRSRTGRGVPARRRPRRCRTCSAGSIRSPDRAARCRCERIRRFGAARPQPRPAECELGHCGVDLGTTLGEPVFAIFDGVIERIERDEDSGGAATPAASCASATRTAPWSRATSTSTPSASDLREGMTVKGGELIGTRWAPAASALGRRTCTSRSRCAPRDAAAPRPTSIPSRCCAAGSCRRCRLVARASSRTWQLTYYTPRSSGGQPYLCDMQVEARRSLSRSIHATRSFGVDLAERRRHEHVAARVEPLLADEVARPLVVGLVGDDELHRVARRRAARGSAQSIFADSPEPGVLTSRMTTTPAGSDDVSRWPPVSIMTSKPAREERRRTARAARAAGAARRR